MTATDVSQALILAGGQATRMRPYTDDAPKAMVPVAGAPIVGHQLVWLAAHGVRDVVISGGYRHEMITDYVGDGSRFGLDVRYAIEDEPLGRGGGLKFAARRLADPARPFFVLNGDVISRFSLADFAAYHDDNAGAVTIALSPTAPTGASPTSSTATASRASPSRRRCRTGSMPGCMSSTPTSSTCCPPRATTRTRPSPNSHVTAD